VSIETTTPQSPQRPPQFLLGSLRAWISSHHADILAVIILPVGTLAIFVPTMYLMIIGSRGDYGTHIDVAERLVTADHIISPHFLYPSLITFLVILLPELSLASAPTIPGGAASAPATIGPRISVMAERGRRQHTT
jgi:hypothetical protein